MDLVCCPSAAIHRRRLCLALGLVAALVSAITGVVPAADQGSSPEIPPWLFKQAGPQTAISAPDQNANWLIENRSAPVVPPREPEAFTIPGWLVKAPPPQAASGNLATQRSSNQMARQTSPTSVPVRIGGRSSWRVKPAPPQRIPPTGLVHENLSGNEIPRWLVESKPAVGSTNQSPTAQQPNSPGNAGNPQRRAQVPPDATAQIFNVLVKPRPQVQRDPGTLLSNNQSRDERLVQASAYAEPTLTSPTQSFNESDGVPEPGPTQQFSPERSPVGNAGTAGRLIEAATAPATTDSELAPIDQVFTWLADAVKSIDDPPQRASQHIEQPGSRVTTATSASPEPSGWGMSNSPAPRQFANTTSARPLRQQRPDDKEIPDWLVNAPAVKQARPVSNAPEIPQWLYKKPPSPETGLARQGKTRQGWSWLVKAPPGQGVPAPPTNDNSGIPRWLVKAPPQQGSTPAALASNEPTVPTMLVKSPPGQMTHAIAPSGPAIPDFLIKAAPPQESFASSGTSENSVNASVTSSPASPGDSMPVSHSVRMASSGGQQQNSARAAGPVSDQSPEVPDWLFHAPSGQSYPPRGTTAQTDPEIPQWLVKAPPGQAAAPVDRSPEIPPWLVQAPHPENGTPYRGDYSHDFAEIPTNRRIGEQGGDAPSDRRLSQETSDEELSALPDRAPNSMATQSREATEETSARPLRDDEVDFHLAKLAKQDEASAGSTEGSNSDGGPVDGSNTEEAAPGPAENGSNAAANDADGDAGDNKTGEEQTFGKEPPSNNNSLQFLRRESVLLKPGDWQFDTGLVYTLFNVRLPVPVVNNNQQVTNVIPGLQARRLLYSPFAARVGLTDRCQFFSFLPVGEAFGEVQANGVQQTTYRGGLGDMTFGTNYLCCEGNRGYCPTVMANFAVTAPTGDFTSPILGVVPGSSLSQGFWALAGQVLFINRYDPIVAFYGLGYRHLFQRSFDGHEFQPGEQINYQFGIGFAVNDRVTLSTMLQGFYITNIYLDSNRVPGTNFEPISLRFAATIARGCKILEPFATIGATDLAPAAQLGIIVTYR